MSTPEEPRVSLNEIARQMREQRNSDNSVRSAATREFRETRPQAVEPQAAPLSPAAQAPVPARTGLRSLALAHRLQTLTCAVVILSFLAFMFLSDPLARAKGQGSSAPDNVVLGSFLLYAVATWWLVFRLFRWVGVIFFASLAFFLGFAPLAARAIAAILSFVVLNGLAARKLRKAGAKVGFFGVSPASMPE